MKKVKLNLGCGFKKRKDYINADIGNYCNPDLILDLEKTPYDFSSDSVDEVYMQHCLEHIVDLRSVLNEIYSILKPGGIFHFKVPHFSYWFCSSISYQRFQYCISSNFKK